MIPKRPLDGSHKSKSKIKHPPKRLRTLNAQEIELARIFDTLADETKDLRIQAAVDLVTFVKTGNENKPETTDKILTRLFRGLCSGRKAARYGFYVALTEILHVLFSEKDSPSYANGLSIEYVIEKILSSTQYDGNAPKQERRDCLFGRLFGCDVIFRSKIIYLPRWLPQSCKSLYVILLDLAREVPWLREECCATLCQAIRGNAEFESAPTHASEIIDLLSEKMMIKTPLGVAVWLSVRSAFPSLNLPKDCWYKQDPLHSKEWVALAAVLRDEVPSDPDNLTKDSVVRGAAQRSVTFAWDIVLSTFFKDTLTPPDSQNGTTSGIFERFWKVTVDESLFSASSSLEKKSWGLQIFRSVIESGPVQVLPAIFSQNLMRCLINQYSEPDRYLHTAAKCALKAMRDRAESDAKVVDVLITGLSGPNGAPNFDQLTKSKTVEGILSVASDEMLSKTLERLGSLLSSSYSGTAEPDSFKEIDLVFAFLPIVKGFSLARPLSKELKSTKSWLGEYITILVNLGYSVYDNSSWSISERRRAAFQTALNSCVIHLAASKQDEDVLFGMLAVQMCQKLHEQSRLAVAGDDGVWQTIQKAEQTLDRLSMSVDQNETSTRPATKAVNQDGSGVEQKPTARAIRLLYILTLLQAYAGDAEAFPILQDLDTQCTEASDQSDRSTMVLEILLSFLSKPSVPLLRVVNQVLEAFASSFSLDGVKLMTDILNQPENAIGQKNIFQNEEIEGGGDDDDDDSSVSGSLEEDPINGANESEIIEATGSDESSEVASGDDDILSASANASDDLDVERALDESDKRLAETLQTRVDSAESGSKGSDAEDMNDEQMMALDSHLSLIFKERENIRTKRKDLKVAKTSVINFKNRVLDILQTLVRQEHTNPLWLHLIYPLLLLIRQSRSKQLTEKAFRISKQYYDTCRNKGYPLNVEVKSVCALLATVHDEAVEGESKIHTAACSRASLFLVKIMTGQDPAHYRQAADQYAKTQKRWYLDSDSRMQPSIFTEWTSWSIATRKI